jgi:hypothetical protein
MKIPYGLAHFVDLREQGYFYVDKTAFIPLLEHPDTSRHLLLLRPRRFGKSLLLNMLAAYYDCALAERFDELFAGLHVHAHPTAERARYFVLQLDFSTVAGHGGEAHLESSFVDAVRGSVRVFLRRYKEQAPAYGALLDKLDRYHSATGLLIDLLSTERPAGRKLYVLIDEYDAFVNDLLSARRMDVYHKVLESTGFVRTFFKTLKASSGRDISRLLFTGVSPMALDDMASGFNIASQITLDPRFHAVCGFTRADMEQVVDAFLAETPQLGPRERLLGDLIGSYNGYRFSENADERLCNPDMVLYYLLSLRTRRRPPVDLLDKNVRTDYGKLRQLTAPPSGALETWHQEILETLVTEGSIATSLVDSFGVRHLYEPAHLISLLFYMGLLTIDRVEEGLLRLMVPNLVMRRMHWEELTRLLREHSGVLVDVGHLAQAVSRMAYHGELAPFLDLLKERVLTVLSNRDLMQFDEKHLKMLLLSYLSLSPIYRPLSEKEIAQGYGDLLLALDRRFPDARYAYLLELKYLRTGATEEELAQKRTEGEAQLARYLRDESLLPALLGERTIIPAVIVFRGAREYHLYQQPARAP